MQKCQKCDVGSLQTVFILQPFLTVSLFAAAFITSNFSFGLRWNIVM